MLLFGVMIGVCGHEHVNMCIKFARVRVRSSWYVYSFLFLFYFQFLLHTRSQTSHHEHTKMSLYMYVTAQRLIRIKVYHSILHMYRFSQMLSKLPSNITPEACRWYSWHTCISSQRPEYDLESVKQAADVYSQTFAEFVLNV